MVHIMVEQQYIVGGFHSSFVRSVRGFGRGEPSAVVLCHCTLTCEVVVGCLRLICECYNTYVVGCLRLICELCAAVLGLFAGTRRVCALRTTPRSANRRFHARGPRFRVPTYLWPCSDLCLGAGGLGRGGWCVVRWWTGCSVQRQSDRARVRPHRPTSRRRRARGA